MLTRLIIIGFISILGGELGWRGFLQDALRPLSKAKRYALIPVMWELWRFTNRTHNGQLSTIIIRVGLFILVLYLLSWVCGEAVARSRSFVTGVTLHFWFNLLFQASAFFGSSPVRAFIILALSVIFWFYLLGTWTNTSGELRVHSLNEAEDNHLSHI